MKRGFGSLYQRGAIWWLKYYRSGRVYRESSESTEREEAERQLKRRLGEIVTGKFAGLALERIRVSELLQGVVEDYKLHRKATLGDVRSRIKLHLGPALGRIRAAQLSTHELERYIVHRREAGAADATINRELAILRRAFSLGAESDPPSVVRRIHVPRLQERNVREGFIEHEQYRELRDALPSHLKALFVVGYHVGVRIGELRKIQWPQVDLAGGEIRLTGAQTKNGRPRTLPIYGDMKHWLLWLQDEKRKREEKRPPCPWVFHFQGRQIGNHMKGWREACKAVGVDGLLFHDLRRSAVRNMERAGIPRKIAMEISGHKTESVYRRYDIISRQDLATAAAKMETYLGTISGTMQPEQAEPVQKQASKALN